ncbi:unnamed protein product [Closterium sp. Yama58-4]|nr:unnamed protein product [Closterium sp. Yama58-4]
MYGTALLAEYAYVLAPGGTLYSITDVEELGVWMDDHLAAHPLFRKLTAAQMEADPVIPLLSTSSEEGLKVSCVPVGLTSCRGQDRAVDALTATNAVNTCLLSFVRSCLQFAMHHAKTT